MSRVTESTAKHSFLTGQFRNQRMILGGVSVLGAKTPCRVVTGRMLMGAALAGWATGVAAPPGPMHACTMHKSI